MEQERKEQALSFICGPLLAFSDPEGRSLITQQLFAEMREIQHVLLLSLQLQRVADPAIGSDADPGSRQWPRGAVPL